MSARPSLLERVASQIAKGSDQLLAAVSPAWGLRRAQARARAAITARHYDAAGGGRRTAGWKRFSTDANAANGPALTTLRELSRDLRRNNGWAQRGIETIVNNVVGWGIMPRASNRSQARSAAALDLWNAWALSTSVDFDGRMNLYGLQRLVMETIVESGEALVLRQPANSSDGLAIPLRLQVLEPDYLDGSKSGTIAGGGRIVDGVEFDAQGRRVAYWLFQSHPGANRVGLSFASTRVPADRVLHVYRVDRPGQVRGVPWLASAITRLNDLDDFEDAELLRQKLAASFGAFVTDPTGDANPLGKIEDETGNDDEELEHLEPGAIKYLEPGEQITFPTMPAVTDAAFAPRVLRRIAAGLGVTYEDLTGDYSQATYSSARMARLAHWRNVDVWREHTVIPALCAGVWGWAMGVASALEGWPTVPTAAWSSPPMPILDPEKEGLAYQRLVRSGAMTWPQMIRELGEDPIAQLDEIQEFNAEMDARGIVLDIDPRKTSAGGQQQATSASSSASATEAPPP